MERSKKFGLSEQQVRSNRKARSILRNMNNGSQELNVPDYAAIVDFEAQFDISPENVQLAIKAIQPLYQEDDDNPVYFDEEDADLTTFVVKTSKDSRENILVKIVSNGEERQQYLKRLFGKELSEKQCIQEFKKLRLIVLVIPLGVSVQKIEQKFKKTVEDTFKM